MSILRDHVEGVVAEIRATDARKDRMREEILAHLAEVYREEAARLGEGHEAADRAIRRLGDPKELAASLQASVPVVERVFFAPLPPLPGEGWLGRALLRREGETPIRHAARSAGWMIALNAPIQFLMVAAVAVTRGGRVDAPVIASFFVASLVLMGLGAFIAPLICEGMALSLRERSRRPGRAALYAAASSLVVIALAIVFVLVAEYGSGRGPLFPRAYWPHLLAMSLAAPPFVVVAAKESNARRRRAEGWMIPGAPA